MGNNIAFMFHQSKTQRLLSSLDRDTLAAFTRLRNYSIKEILKYYVFFLIH